MALNLKIVGVSCVRFLSFKYHMKALPEQNLICEVLRSKASRISNPNGIKKLNFPSKGPTSSKIY